MYVHAFYNMSNLSANLQQVTQVGAEAISQTVNQLAERQVRAGGEGVAVGAKGTGQVCASLQHSDLCVLLYNTTCLRQQQVQMLTCKIEDRLWENRLSKTCMYCIGHFIGLRTYSRTWT